MERGKNGVAATDVHVSVRLYHKIVTSFPNPGTKLGNLWQLKIHIQILEHNFSTVELESLVDAEQQSTHPHALTHRGVARTRHSRKMSKRARTESLRESAKKLPARPLSAAAAAIWLLSCGGEIIGAAGLFVCETGGWDVTPSEAYTWSHAPPQGCTCQETGVPLADCKAS